MGVRKRGLGNNGEGETANRIGFPLSFSPKECWSLSFMTKPTLHNIFIYSYLYFYTIMTTAIKTHARARLPRVRV